MIELLRDDPDIWSLYARREEYDSRIRDCYGRFPHYASRHGNIFEPAVSRFLINKGWDVRYPDDHPFAVCLTHDIDVVYQPLKRKWLDALGHIRSKEFSRFFTSLSAMRSKKIPWWNFSEILALEETYGATSSFYYLTQGAGDPDHSYLIEDLAGEIATISDKGWEVGLHGGRESYLNPARLADEKRALEKVLNKRVCGFRSHYLRFLLPDTWHHLRAAGFDYDTTLGYADCVGFRNGMCHPFHPYDLRQEREIAIVEIPVTVMDNTLDAYMRLNTTDAWDIIRRLIDEVERCHGVFTILWHNTSMEGDNLRLYRKLLAYCREKNAWMTSGKEIADHFLRGSS